MTTDRPPSGYLPSMRQALSALSHSRMSQASAHPSDDPTENRGEAEHPSDPARLASNTVDMDRVPGSSWNKLWDETSGSTAEPSSSLTPESKPTGCPALDDVRDFIARYLVLPGPWDAEVLTLWVAHTHLIDAFDVTPRVAFLSPQKASGKTRAMEVLGLLVQRPISAVNTTAAALVHSIDQAGGHTTLLLDEVDTVFGSRSKGAEELRGVLNGGYKRGAQVLRAGSRRGPVERYDTFSPVALAGLGKLPDTLMSRSIVFNMHRRRSDELVSAFRPRDAENEAASLRVVLAGWASSAAGHIAVPKLPAELTDRAAEIWEPILAVADAAGDSWARTARVAAVAAVAGSSKHDDEDTELLAAIKTVFDDSGETALYTTDLLRQLTAQDTLWLPNLNPSKLAALLAPYGIQPTAFRQGQHNNRGYQRSAFEDAWSRYL